MNDTTIQRLHFLDGLRGWGSVIVLLYHIWIDGFPLSKESSIFLKYIINGYLAIYLFFIVSGFSLTISYFKKNDPIILKKLLIGRYFRLIIPIGFASSIFFILLNSGFVLEPNLRPERFRSFITDQISFLEFFQFHFFEVLVNNNFNKSLIPPLWTMQFEFIGSIIIMLSLLMIHKIEHKLLIIIIFTIFSSFINLIYGLFFLGVFFAWLYFKNYTIKNYLGGIIFFVCVLLYPIRAKLPIINDLDYVFYVFMAISLFIAALSWQPFNVFLSSKLSIYLGKISFSLYLIHSVVIWVIGLPLIGLLDQFYINIICMFFSLIFAHFMTTIDNFATMFSRKIGVFFFK